MPVPLRHHLRPLAAALLCGLLAAALCASPAAASPVGYWKLYVSLDYSSEGTAVDSHCHATPGAPFSTLKANATEAVSIRTIRPGLVEMRRAASHLPVVRERRGAPPMRVAVTATRASGLDGIEPAGCGGRPPAGQPDCGTKTLTTGIQLAPAGTRAAWLGLKVAPRQLPVFASCTLTAAQGLLPPSLPLELGAAASQLTSKAEPLIPFHDEGLTTNAPQSIDGDVTSFGHGTVAYSARLVRATPKAP